MKSNYIQIPIPEYFSELYNRLNSDQINSEIEEMKLMKIDIVLDNFGISSVENSSQSELNSDADEIFEIPNKNSKERRIYPA